MRRVGFGECGLTGQMNESKRSGAPAKDRPVGFRRKSRISHVALLEGSSLRSLESPIRSSAFPTETRCAQNRSEAPTKTPPATSPPGYAGCPAVLDAGGAKRTRYRSDTFSPRSARLSALRRLTRSPTSKAKAKPKSKPSQLLQESGHQVLKRFWFQSNPKAGLVSP